MSDLHYCPECNGKGVAKECQGSAWPFPCKNCDGTGWLDADGEPIELENEHDQQPANHPR